MIEFKRSQGKYSGIEIKPETVERVKRYMYNFRRITIVEMSCRCSICCLRKYRSFGVREGIWQMLYKVTIGRISTAWLVGVRWQLMKTKQTRQEHQEGWWGHGLRQERIDTACQRLATNKLRTCCLTRHAE